VDGTVVDIGDLGIFFVEHGEGLPVVYVHGNTGSSRWFERVMDVPGARAIALDMPNFGRSKPLPGEPDIDRYADAVAAFVRARALDRPVLVGHSLGGGVAISLAARAPTLIRGLVLVDSAAPSGLVTPKERHPLIEMMRTNRAVLTQALRAIVPTLADEAFFASLVDDAAKMAAPAWVGNAEALSRFDYRGRTAAFKGPTLVVWGRKDVIVTEAMARETAAAFPGARLEVIDDVGHSVMVEKPARFIALIADFIRDRRLAP
jgi:branched-chain amino acid transport system permease protein